MAFWKRIVTYMHVINGEILTANNFAFLAWPKPLKPAKYNRKIARSIIRSIYLPYSHIIVANRSNPENNNNA